MNNLTEKTGLITGATSGIGLAISVLLVKQGVKLFLLGRNFDHLKTELKKIKVVNPPVFVELDISNPETTEVKINVLKEENSIDFLIHSAGLISLNLIEEATIEDFNAQYHVNVRAAFQITKLLLPNIKKSKGTIIFLNSTAGLESWENLGIYASTKHALRALATSLRKEMQEFQIKVTSIYCGSVDTPMQEKVQSSRNNSYHSELFIDANQIAFIILNILELPPDITISDMTVLGNKG